MIPNWLLGKSKSKLQEILGGGGGTPADYNQVKAQVNQNTEDIALLDTSNQVLTKQANSIANVLGAKNIVPNVAKTQTVNGITYTANSDGSITINGTATGWAQSYVIQGLLHKGTYKISIGTALPTKVWATLRNVDASSTILNLGNGSSTVEKSFTLSSDTNVGLFCGIEGGITVNNLTVYPMIRPASIQDDTYVPYSMTNQELTEELTADANLSTAVDLSTYTSYLNMYTAPSDGYVHFLSAASGSAARTIYTYGNNTTAATDPHFTHSTSANNKAFEIFIKKGLMVYIDGLQSNDTINFYPLSTST